MLKTIVCFGIAVLLLYPSFSHGLTNKGLIRICAGEAPDGNSKSRNKNIREFFKTHCKAYVSGIIEGIIETQIAIQAKSKTLGIENTVEVFCPPKGATIDQFIATVVKFAKIFAKTEEGNPKDVFPVGMAAVTGLSGTYKCK